MPADNKGVLVLYTGGTIGSRPRDPGDPESPQLVVKWEELVAATPEIAPEKVGFRVDHWSLDPPLDSCNVGPQQWRELAVAIRDNYDDYEGFVCLHGTDTMVYTASILSFMLQNLGKPVVVTGAQRSAMVGVRNDATQNFVTALQIANPSHTRIAAIPEVVICFGGLVLRGNRTVKMDTAGYDAYDSPNMPPLATVGDKIQVNERMVRRPPAGSRFRVNLDLETNVMPVLVYPGIQQTKLVQSQLGAGPKGDPPGPRAAVVLAYGSGNIPTDAAFLGQFDEAREGGAVLATVTQCLRGPVDLGIYETSAKLLQAGFRAASDITTEAAQCKLMWLLGDQRFDEGEIPELFERSWAGEQSTSVYVTHYAGAADGHVAAGDQRLCQIPARPLHGQWSDESPIERIVLRFMGTHLTSPKNADRVSFLVFSGFVSLEDANDKHPDFAGRFTKYTGHGPGSVMAEGEASVAIFDVTRAVLPDARPDARIGFTIMIESDAGTLDWKKVELAVYVRETSPS